MQIPRRVKSAEPSSAALPAIERCYARPPDPQSRPQIASAVERNLDALTRRLGSGKLAPCGRPVRGAVRLAARSTVLPICTSRTQSSPFLRASRVGGIDPCRAPIGALLARSARSSAACSVRDAGDQRSDRCTLIRYQRTQPVCISHALQGHTALVRSAGGMEVVHRTRRPNRPYLSGATMRPTEALRALRLRTAMPSGLRMPSVSLSCRRA